MRLPGVPMGLRGRWRRLCSALAARFGLGRVRVAGECRQCGYCCREIRIWADGGWIASRRALRRLLRSEPEYARLEVVGRDPAGRLIFTCSWLTEDGRCRDHEHRLDLCRSHPGPGLYFAGVELSPLCGYRMVVPRLRDLWRRPGPSFQDCLDQARQPAESPAAATDDSA
ncbi:MAG: YkgJ family cysteine cluster protein [Desulfovibrionaceae bacterium]